MNWVSLRNNRLKLETWGESPIVLEESIEGLHLKWMKQQNRKMLVTDELGEFEK